MLRSTTVLRQSARQVSCTLDGEVAILDLDKAVYFGLDGVGVHVWQALAEPRSLEELCDAVLERFDVTPDRCHADLVQFIGRLQDAGLVEVVDRPSA